MLVAAASVFMVRKLSLREHVRDSLDDLRSAGSHQDYDEPHNQPHEEW